MIRAITNKIPPPYGLWTLFSLPAVPMLYSLTTGGSPVDPSGTLSAVLLAITLSVTPLLMLFPKSTAIRWMMKHRRHLGVAAFGYAAIHTLAYLFDAGSSAFAMNELTKLYIWTGWIAFAIFVPLAITSNTSSVRAMGRNWKTLQRATYVSALLVLAHWIFVEFELVGALVVGAPIAALQIYRVWRNWNPIPRSSRQGDDKPGKALVSH